MAPLWAVVVLVFNAFGWMIYMVVRPPEYADDALERDLEIRAREAEIQREGATCPSCLKPIDPDYLVCPYCMKKLKKQCVSLSLIHISEPTRLGMISYAVFCL